MYKNKERIKLDEINKKILATIHGRADISNQELADEIGLSPSACFQRTKALKDAGYFPSFHTELDLGRLCEHVLAYVEFTLDSNKLANRQMFEAAIEEIPEFMDCLRISGESDYISFTCSSSIEAINELCDQLSGDEKLGIKSIKQRIILGRAKFYLGYPLEKLKWLE